MSQKEDLEPELKAIFDIIAESGEEGTDLRELFDTLEKDDKDRDTLIAVMTGLGELTAMGYIHKRIVEVERDERGTISSIKWFEVGKGESAKEGSPFMGMPG
jgi:Ca2+-binding EF-hand superfamily protein